MNHDNDLNKREITAITNQSNIHDDYFNSHDYSQTLQSRRGSYPQDAAALTAVSVVAGKNDQWGATGGEKTPSQVT